MDKITLFWMDGQRTAQAFQVFEKARFQCDGEPYDPDIVIMKYPGHKHCGCDKSKIEIIYFIEHDHFWEDFPIYHTLSEILSVTLATHLEMDLACSSYGVTLATHLEMDLACSSYGFLS